MLIKVRASKKMYSKSNSPHSLEADFDNLYVNPGWKTRTQLIHPRNNYSKIRRKSSTDILPPHACGCRKFYSTGRSVLRPAKLNFVSISKKSSLIRPAKLNVKESKMFLLKPATLIVKDKHRPLRNSKFTAISGKSEPGISLSIGQVFNSDKVNSLTSFKSLAASEDTAGISQAFDALSFRKLRCTRSPSSEVSSATNKRENTSSCSVQARMESNVPVDCDDTSIEELASYFDLFVHIPKKMSSMAEMMYI